MIVQKERRCPMKKKKLRTLFPVHKIQTMEKEFAKCRYVSEGRRAELASDLDLTEMQVKTWFQNRRTKWKKETSYRKGNSFAKELKAKFHWGKRNELLPCMGATSKLLTF